MKSKKEKLTKKVQEEVQKNIGKETQPTYKEVLQEIQQSPTEQTQTSEVKSHEISDQTQKRNTDEKIKKNQDKSSQKENSEYMSTKRDSIYNVSSDIRLEDYVEEPQKKDFGPYLRYVLIFLIILLLIFGLWKLGTWLFAPKYYLSISNTEITDENYKTFIKNKQIPLYPGQLIHIRFTYLELKSNFYTIQILRKDGAALSEEATFGRKIPRTVNYIYYAGTLDPGSYVVRVFDENREILIEREIEVVSQ
ncbi:MAG: hypothetical protein NZ853_01325 [Leptospiraceae bacterium]|nr:hypothetical protein [Leptospiraceae bacterium]MDW7976131.1 hypothetical protein [Leptospiraceae bacterium]